MKHSRGYCPEWSWWIRAGERCMLGLDLRQVLVPDGKKGRTRDHGIFDRMHELLGSGSGVAEAMRGAPIHLPVEGWSLLRAGEQTGKLGEAMRQVGELLRERESRRRAIMGQLWYPAMVGCTGLIVMGIILFWVIPQMREMSASMGLGDQLPWLTRNIGWFYGALFLSATSLSGLAAATLFALRVGAGRSLKCGACEEQTFRFFPVFGRVREKTREARLLRQLGTLLQAGTTIPAALELAAESSSSEWERQQLGRFRSSLLMGLGFSASIQACPLFDRESIPLLEAGQESGRLEAYMERLATSRDEEAGWKLAQVTRFVEPAFLFLLSGAIGGMVLAYLLPMVRLLEQAGSTF